MLLTTTGAKTGLPRTLPLLYLTDGERLILDCVELRQDVSPGVVPESCRQSEGGRARRHEKRDLHRNRNHRPAERDRAWDLALDMYAGYGDYESRAGDRTIPLIRLERVPT